MFTNMDRRSYRLGKRAESVEQTRARIVEATMALHEQLGPAGTTISAIAERAGVQRLTVYRHFADENALFAACTGTWLGLHPPPTVADWSDERDPAARTRAALLAVFGYYRRTRRMWSVSYRDREAVPAVEIGLTRFDEHVRGLRDDLVAAWPRPGRQLAATLGHCLHFHTWETLAAQGLDDAEMAALCLRWAEAAAIPSAAAV